MSDRDDGGPAFPCEGGIHPNMHPGMSLWDWFAGQTLAGLFAGNASQLFDPAEDIETHAEKVNATLAEIACSMADAMLKARKQP